MRAIVTTLLLLAAAPALADPAVTTFDVPGAQYTAVTAISPSGIVAGYYGTGQAGSCASACGFLRAPTGTITTFSIGDAGVIVTGVNDSSTVTGYYTQKGRLHGFLRTLDGTVTKIGGPHVQVSAHGINESGIVMGEIGHAFPINKGFLRAPDGTMTLFKGQRCDSIETLGINAAGATAGICDSNGEKGFVRQPDGAMSLFKFQGSADTDALAIDDGGDVAGFYFPRHMSATQGFVRDPDGTLHSYSFPTDFGSLGIDSIALVGGDRQTVGHAFLISEKLWHGWIRHDNGTFELFRVDQGTQPNTGTIVAAMNPSGVIAGTYTNDDKVEHGYIRTP